MVLTLALGIGATLSVFSIIHAVMITPLPYDDPSHLFSVFESKIANDEDEMEGFAPGNFLDLRAQNQTFSDLAAYFGAHFNLTGSGEPRHLKGSAVSQGLFAILGAQPMLGRTFFPEEDSYAAPHVVLLSSHLWAGVFHGDRQIIGKTVSLNGDPYYVVGVMRPSFVDPGDDDADLWIPLQQQIRPDRMLLRDAHFLGVVGRLRPGIALDQARADMNRIVAQLKMQNPTSDSGSGAVVMSLQKAKVGETGKSLLLALGIVVLVLLIASSNVAILMLARASGRTRELAVRSALGASRPQILREVLSESVILGLISGLLGLMLALVGRKLFLQFAPYAPNVELIRINPAVLTFALIVSVIVGLGFGMLPALKVLRTDVQQILRSAGNASTVDSGGRFVRHMLLVGEISLSIVLLVATGLLLRSTQNLQNQPLGFRANHLIATWIGLPRIRYQNNADVASFFTRVDQQLLNSSEVEAVGLGYPLPLQGNHFWTSVSISGRPAPPGEYEEASLCFVDSGFLPLLEIPVLYGRNFTDQDDAHTQPVTIVSASFARKYWPGDSALGKYVTILRDNPVPSRVIGVVADVRATIEDDPPPSIYVSYKQMSFPSMQVVLRVRGASSSALRIVKQAVQSVDPEQPVEYATSMESMVHEALDPWRFAVSLLGGLAGIATLLTGVGLFAVVSYLVRERTKEVGVRMAVGATKADVMKLVLRQSIKLSLLGTIIGFALTVAVARFMTRLTYAIRPNDPAVFLAVAIFVAMIATLAAYIPARRAAAIEPLAALRED